MSTNIDPMEASLGPDPSNDVIEAFSPEDWPRDHSAYCPTMHYRQKCREEERCVKPKTTVRCIEEGEVIPTRNRGEAKFYHEDSGVVHYLVVGGPSTAPEGECDYRAITIWPWVEDETEARRSFRWTNSEIEQMKAVNQRLKQS